MPSRSIIVVKLLQYLGDVGKLRLRLLDDLGQLFAALFLCDVICARIVLELTVVLDLLARILDFGEAERGGRALEEVTELAELLKRFRVVFLAAALRVSRSRSRCCLASHVQHSQLAVHFLEGRVGLGEEVVDDALAELALVLIVVHLENLLKGGGVDGIFGTSNGHYVAALLGNV